MTAKGCESEQISIFFFSEKSTLAIPVFNKFVDFKCDLLIHENNDLFEFECHLFASAGLPNYSPAYI